MTRATAEIRLDFTDSALARAVSNVIAESGRRVAENTGRVVVSDAPASCADVVVIPLRPASCHAAMRATPGDGRSIVGADRVEDVVAALDAIDAGFHLVRHEVFTLAALIPDLDVRPRAVLDAVMAGLSNRDIARSLHVSEATVKRTVGDLLATFGAPTRGQLAARATKLGFNTNGFH